jgi:hypothetical protein
VHVVAIVWMEGVFVCGWRCRQGGGTVRVVAIVWAGGVFVCGWLVLQMGGAVRMIVIVWLGVGDFYGMVKVNW